MYKRLGRFELGVDLKYWEFSLYKAGCNCYLWNLGPIFITYMGDECYDEARSESSDSEDTN